MISPKAIAVLVLLPALASCGDNVSLPQEPILLDGRELHYTENSGCFAVSFDTAGVPQDTMAFVCGNVSVRFIELTAHADAATLARRMGGLITTTSPFRSDSVSRISVDGPVGREKQMIKTARSDARVELAVLDMLIITNLP